MPDVLRLAEVDYFFGDARGVIADSLQTFDRHEQMQTTLDVIRTLLHVFYDLRLNLLVQKIDFFVAGNHGSGSGGILLHKRIQG